MILAIINNRGLSIIKYLVEHGAKINDIGIGFRSVLSFATERGNLDVVKYLVEHGDEVDEIDCCDKTALYYAIELEYLEVVKHLVEHGADINLEDERGYTPLT